MDDKDKERERKEAELRRAAAEGDTDRVKRLLAEGVNHSAAGGLWQWTPLHVAAEEGHHETVSALLTAGADVNARDKWQFTPLHRAALKGHHETVSVLLTAGADVNARNDEQITPLHLTALKGHHETVSALLPAGADVNAWDKWERTPLHWAAECGYHETASALLTAGADVNARDDDQCTPLHKAARHGHHETVSALLAAGADVNARDKWKGRTAEDIAADEDTGGVCLVNKDEKERIIRGRKEILRLLREEKSKGRTADDIAADEDTGGVSTCNKDEGERRTRSRKEMLTLLQRDSNGVFASKKEYDPVLVRFYEEKGMTVAKRNCPLIQEAAKESGKSVARVINFIGNYRKSRGGSKRRPPADTVERTRRITGYHEYYREQLPRKKDKRGFSLAGANKEIGESWKSLTDEEKDGYNRAAKRRRGEETQVKTWSEVSKKLKQLEKLSEELGDLGVESLVVTLYNGRIRTFGSQKDLAKDEMVGGYIENQLKAAELQRKAAKCLTLNRPQRNPSTEDTRGVSNEDLAEAGTSASSGKSPRKKSKKDKGAQSKPQSSPKASSSSTSSLLVKVTPAGLPHRTTHLSAAKCLTLNRPQRNPSTEDTRGVSNEDLAETGTSTSSGKSPRKKRKKDKGAQSNPQSSPKASSSSTSSSLVEATSVGMPQRTTQISSPTPLTQAGLLRRTMSIPVSPNTRTTLDALDKLEALVRHPAVFGDSHVPPGGGDPFGLPDRTTSSPNLPTVLPTSLTRGTTTLTTGGLPHTTSQIPTAPNTGPPADRQAHTNINPLVVFSTFSASPYLDTGR